MIQPNKRQTRAQNDLHRKDHISLNECLNIKVKSYNYKSKSPAPSVGTRYNDKGKTGNICTWWGMSGLLWTQETTRSTGWQDRKPLWNCSMNWANVFGNYPVLNTAGEGAEQKFTACQLVWSHGSTESGCWEVQRPGQSREGSLWLPVTSSKAPPAPVRWMQKRPCPLWLNVKINSHNLHEK